MTMSVWKSMLEPWISNKLKRGIGNLFYISKTKIIIYNTIITVKPLKNLVETAQELGAKKFIQQAEQSGLFPLLSDRGAYTLFIAPDRAFQSLTKDQEKALNSSKKSRSRPPVLLYTVAEGRVPAEDLPNFLTTLYREGSVVVNKFQNGVSSILEFVL